MCSRLLQTSPPVGSTPIQFSTAVSASNHGERSANDEQAALSNLRHHPRADAVIFAYCPCPVIASINPRNVSVANASEDWYRTVVSANELCSSCTSTVLPSSEAAKG